MPHTRFSLFLAKPLTVFCGTLFEKHCLQNMASLNSHYPQPVQSNSHLWMIFLQDFLNIFSPLLRVTFHSKFGRHFIFPHIIKNGPTLDTLKRDSFTNCNNYKHWRTEHTANRLTLDNAHGVELLLRKQHFVLFICEMINIGPNSADVSFPNVVVFEETLDYGQRTQ